MSPPQAVVLRHGTTRVRAERLMTTPPDPAFVEPGGDWYSRAGGISFVIAGTADRGLGSAERYARAKASVFPAEGPPVILEVEIPEAIFRVLADDPFGADVVASGEVRFEPDLGLSELRQAWPQLPKRILTLSPP
jgi:hypothetical protein